MLEKEKRSYGRSRCGWVVWCAKRKASAGTIYWAEGSRQLCWGLKGAVFDWLERTPEILQFEMQVLDKGDTSNDAQHSIWKIFHNLFELTCSTCLQPAWSGEETEVIPYISIPYSSYIVKRLVSALMRTEGRARVSARAQHRR